MPTYPGRVNLLARRWPLSAPLIGCCLIVMLASCSASNADPAALLGKSFTADEATIGGVTQPLALDSTLTLTFTDDGISAKADCNSMFATANLDDGVITTTTPMGMTMMACEQPLMDQDQWISDFLVSGPSWALDGSMLTLTSGDDVLVLRSVNTA
jgi:heat shock protein HslJ